MIYLFSILITVLAYLFSINLKKVLKHPIVNSVLVSAIIILLFLKLINVEVGAYKEGASLIVKFLNPLIVLLAVPLYKKRDLLKSNMKAIVIGILTSILVAFTSVIVLGSLLDISKVLILTLVPKSVTTPLAIEASNLLGGISSITVLAVIITGISGTLLFDFVVKVFNLKSDIAKGLSLGAASHAIGTSKALEVSKECGAVSSLALGLSGIFTVLIVVIISMFI